MLAVYVSANQGYVNILQLVQTQKTIDHGQKKVIFHIGSAATNTAGNCLDVLLKKIPGLSHHYQSFVATIMVGKIHSFSAHKSSNVVLNSGL